MNDQDLGRLEKQLEEVNQHLKAMDVGMTDEFLKSIDATLARINNTLDIIKEEIKRKR